MPPHKPTLQKGDGAPAAATSKAPPEAEPGAAPRETSAGAEKTPAEGPRYEDLRLLIRQAQQSSGKLVIELHEPPKEKSGWQTVAGFFKDALPIIATIATAVVALFTYEFSARQSRLAQADLKTKALEDFIQVDQLDKRTLAAIKLAQYGEDALPVVRQALGVADANIRGGAVLTAEQMFKAPQGVSREQLLGHMLDSFDEKNPTLNLGVLQFYTEVAPLLTNGESADLVALLKRRLGADGSLCGGEEEALVTAAARYLGNKSSDKVKEAPTAEQLGEFKTLLLGLAHNCPWGEPGEDGLSRHDGARIQAATALISVAGRLPRGERDSIANDLRGLAARENASPKFRAAVVEADGALEKIEGIQGP